LVKDVLWIIKNFNFNESPGWIGLFMEAMLSGSWDTCLAEDVYLRRSLVDGHSGLKRFPCPLCFRVLPVQPYDTMGSVLTN
jgi:hypothetical protein